MTEWMPLSIATGLAAGALMGGLYFGGLWWSVLKIKTVERKKLFLFFSWLFRCVFLCGGLFFLANHNSQMLLGAAVGLLSVRFVIVYQVKRKIPQKIKQEEKAAWI